MRSAHVRATVAAIALLAAAPANAPTLQGAHVGFYAVDLATGATLADRDSTSDFVPASTMKLLAGSAALDLLPSDFSFTTRVLIEGNHLYLQGGGDPTLSDKALDDAAVTLATLGIRRIDTLSLDSSRYTGPWYPPGWSIDDLPYDYNAPVTALSFDENVMHVVVAPGAHVGDVARVIQPGDSSLLVSSDEITTGAASSDDTSDIVRDPSATMVHLAGSIPLGANVTLDAAFQDPTRVIAARTFAVLQRHGIDISRATFDTTPTPPSARQIWSRTSVGLAQLLPQFWLPSDNFYGETFLNELGARASGSGTTLDRGIAAESGWLKSFGVDPATFTIADGSGLSTYDRVTPRGVVAILQHDYAGPHRQGVLDALPIAGMRGTLEHRFVDTALKGVLYAKTGTMNHTRTLAGYLITPGHAVAFALLIGDWVDASPDASKSLEAAQRDLLEGLLAR